MSAQLQTQKGSESEDVRLLESLVEMEKRVDALLTTKRLELQDWLCTAARVRCKIKVTISTLFFIPSNHNIPPIELPATKAALAQQTNLGSIELKIEGKLVEATLIPDSGLIQDQKFDHKNAAAEIAKLNKNFSSFFKGIIVEFDPEVYGSDMRSLEWIRNNRNENDGFIVRRPIVTKNNFKVTFCFEENSTPTHFKLSYPLANLLGIEISTKAHIFSMLFSYISLNNLNDLYQPEIVHCNDILKSIFLSETLNINELPSLILSHLTPLKPQTFTIEVDNPLAKNSLTVGVYSSNPHNFDIVSEFSDFFKDVSQPFFIEYGNETLGMNINELQALERQSKALTESIANIKTKIRDYKAYAANPANFVMQWLNSQTQNLSPGQTDSRVLGDEDRSTEFFNKPFIQELVHRYVFNMVEHRIHEIKNQR